MSSYLRLFLLVFNLVVIVNGYRNSTLQECYEYNPFYINGTRNESELRCPDRCNCKYCKEWNGNELYYGHKVYCNSLELTNIPLKNTVPTDAFYYSLKNNLITSLQDNSFSTSSTLEYLRLDANHLTYTSIGKNAFRGLKKLKNFSLSENKYLNQLLALWFVDLISLEKLQARNSGLSTIESNIFQNCKQLKEVHITTNNIVSLPANTFQNLPLLNYIYMGNNKLPYIPNQAFKGSDNILKIAVNDNLLSSISEDVGIQMLNKLQILNVIYNKFSCDCEMVWFRNWIQVTNVTIAKLNNTKCKDDTNRYKNLLDFDPTSIECRKLVMILKIVIPFASIGVIMVIIIILLYNFRYDIRFWIQRRRLRKQYETLQNQGPPPINGDDIRYDAFVSYNSKDQDWVLKCLQPSLEDRNYKLCIDYRDFLPGEAVVNNISNAVKYSRKVIVVVSRNFAKSEWCYFELEMARMRMFENHEDILVVVLLEKVPSKHMPILLHKILTKKTYIEWNNHPEGQALFWNKVETALLSPNCHRERVVNLN
ncbi:toll-like receptor 2 [Antedon mediterranea]|uniref:toll-like receptor 2 n=1 Tax=Antedon mediterranea TaxID=105859 RepID=UPI003AF61BC0